MSGPGGLPGVGTGRPGVYRRDGATRRAWTRAEAVALAFDGWTQVPAVRAGGRRRLWVLAVVHAYPPHHNAGAEWMLHTLLRSLAGRGHDCHVRLSRPSPGRTAYRLDGITVHPRGALGPAPHDVDLVLTHLENTSRTVRAARAAAVPVVHLVHNTHPQTRAWLTSHPADLTVFNSTWMAAELARPGAAHLVVRPPVLPADYATTPGESATLVNLNADKGALTFWALARRLPDLPFVGVVGAYGRQIRRDPVTGDVPRNVVVLDHGTPMRQVYSRTRVLLVPSVYESWGRVAAEAMCSGIPVIAHPTPGLRECLAEAGTFAHRDDVDAWAGHLRRLAQPRQWRAASRAALARSAQLDPAEDLRRWCDAVERLTHEHR